MTKPWLSDEIAANGRSVAENFASWFRNSKVVEHDAKPQVVYHGTKATFDSFKVGVESTNESTFGPLFVRRLGLFFAEDEAFSQTFAVQGDRSNPGLVMPVYLSVQNPLDLTEGFQGLHQSDFDKLMPFIKDNYWAVNLGPDAMWELFDDGTIGSHEFIDVLKKAGFDGVKIVERDRNSECTSVWVALDSCQIKSATDNSGLYLRESASLNDQNEANILKKSDAAKVLIDNQRVRKNKSPSV